MGRGLLFLAAVLAVFACRMPPPAAYDTAAGRIRASTPEEAKNLALIVSQQRASVERLLPGLLDRPVEVWLQSAIAARGDPPRHVAGYTLLEPDAPIGRVRIDARFADREQVVAHELVHALLGPDWRTLPGILEEGLCDWAAAEAAGPAGDVLRATRRVIARAALGRPVPFDVLILDERGRERSRERFLIGTDEPIDVSELGPALTMPIEKLGRKYDRLPSAWYGIGLMLVDRIAERHGIHRLHRACAEAAAAGHSVVPVDELLELAGLTRRDLDRNGLVASLREPSLPAHAWLATLASTDTDLGERVWARASALMPEATVAELLEPGRVLVEVEGGERIDLAADARLRSALVDAWLAAAGPGAPVLAAGH